MPGVSPVLSGIDKIYPRKVSLCLLPYFILSHDALTEAQCKACDIGRHLWCEVQLVLADPNGLIKRLFWGDVCELCREASVEILRLDGANYSPLIKVKLCEDCPFPANLQSVRIFLLYARAPIVQELLEGEFSWTELAGYSKKTEA